MKNISISIFTILSLCFISVHIHANEKLAFWNQQQKGANGDGGAVKDTDTTPDEWFKSAADVGIDFVRLQGIDWKTDHRDFLIGNADNFTEIPPEDFQQLIDVLDIAQKHGVKIEMCMFSLPGARNRQANGMEFDYRLWTDEKFQQQALEFWKQLASNLKDHPAIVAYNPLNEPHPARKDGVFGDDKQQFEDWYMKHKDTPADLNRFNRRIVEAIREVDTQTPIILNGWFHSSSNGFQNLIPVKDDAVLYAHHAYGSWEYVTFRANKDRFSYPDKMPTLQGDETEAWTVDTLRKNVQAVVDFQKKYNIPSNRIIAEEFGVDRRVKGAQQYLADYISVFNEHDWHWAFYSYRSATWDGMDYELGTEKLGWKYWQEIEKGKSHEELITRQDNPLWNIIKRELE